MLILISHMLVLVCLSYYRTRTRSTIHTREILDWVIPYRNTPVLVLRYDIYEYTVYCVRSVLVVRIRILTRRILSLTLSGISGSGALGTK